ncbi:MAG: hypothetical protein KatS3mg035_0647 [Bacteroidia bacterium]|nr:MAG: hypothetical protein KatS3mg035_0647 [Bacteroidia bacterium]
MPFRLHILFIFLLITVLATWGYNYGRGDQAEIIPYALFLNGEWQGELPLFVQNILSYTPNERYAVAHLLAIGGKLLPLTTFILHVTTTYFLILGMYKIAHIYLKEPLAFCVILWMMLPLWGINFGGNELYYNNFQASTIAKAIAIWGLYFYLQNSIGLAFYFFSLATVFHLLAGLQIGFLVLATYLWNSLYPNQKIPKIYISQILFIFLSLAYAISMKIELSKDTPILTDAQYFQAMFQWKFNEHYSMLDAPKAGLILYFISLVSIGYFFSPTFFRTFVLLQIIGTILYFIGFYVFSSSFVVSLQWLKTTIWIKLFGVIALMGILQKIDSRIQKKDTFWAIGVLVLASLILIFKFNRIFLTFTLIGLIFLIIQRRISDNFLRGLLGFITFCGVLNYPERVPLDVYFLKDDKIELCKQIQKIQEKMLVIVPIHFTELESYALKPSYVNFIATPKKNSYFAIYLKRIKDVYGLKPKNFPIKKEIEAAKAFYNQKEWIEWQKFKKQGVTHIITENKIFEGITPVLNKGKWYLWKL